jgi:L-fuculose-phosphate aldolase
VASNDKDVLKEMREIGHDLFLRGLVSSHSGNMSVRVGGEIYITRTKSMLGRLKKGDIVKVPLEAADPETLKIASSETPVHMRIYVETDGRSIIHAHPPYSILTSFFLGNRTLRPLDWEGRVLLKSIPFVEVEEDEEKGRKIANCLKDSKVVVVKGHGSFAIGDNLEEAYMYTMSLEHSCFFLYHLEIQKKWRKK